MIKPAIHIKANLDEPALLENLVEKLSQRRYSPATEYTGIHDFPLTIDSSTTQTFASGTMAMADDEETLYIPFITQFLFTCIKEQSDDYELKFSCSLS